MKVVLPLLLITLLLAVALSPVASSLPDGLEKVSKRLGFADRSTPEPLLSSPLPDYSVPALGESALSTSVAGVIGVLTCFLFPFALYLLRRK